MSLQCFRIFSRIPVVGIAAPNTTEVRHVQNLELISEVYKYRSTGQVSASQLCPLSYPQCSLTYSFTAYSFLLSFLQVSWVIQLSYIQQHSLLAPVIILVSQHLVSIARRLLVSSPSENAHLTSVRDIRDLLAPASTSLSSCPPV